MVNSKNLFKNFVISNDYSLAQIQFLASGKRVIDAILLPPADYKTLEFGNSEQDFSSAIKEKIEIALQVTIISHQPSFKITSKTPYKILAEISGGMEIVIFFFAGNAGMWKSMFKENETYSISCRLQKMGKNFSTSHPKILKNIEKVKKEGGGIFPRYPLSGNLTQTFVTNFIAKHVAEIKDFSDDWQIDKFFLPFSEAVALLHAPKTYEDVKRAKERLAYDELLAKNLAYFVADFRAEKVKSAPIKLNKNFLSKALEMLPFELTEDQVSALNTLLELQSKDIQSNVLLQGDVGSGKTIIAILCALNAVSAGFQVAVMSPTFILAMQTFVSFSEICEKFGVSVIFFSGEDRGKKRAEKLRKIANDEAKIIIGTHALFSSDVVFANLGYAIIDEQHRFGINQRLQLIAKSSGIKSLLMTATPIPRTLSMAIYGEIEVVYIKNKPKNRKNIITKLFLREKLPEIIDAVKRKIATNEQVYWVVPLIDEGEKSDDTSPSSIQMRFLELKKYFDDEVISVVHGRMKEAEIFAEMEKFQSGKTKIMIATTVIEVGVNIPNATLMIIESAENFGLSTLHQLRGRVGRGELQSYCFLISGSKNDAIVNRLKTIVSSNDGFFIAEKDMELRGSGAVFSKMQSGFERFKFADFEEHKHIFKLAKDDAKKIFFLDKNFETEQGRKLKFLLQIYNYDLFINYFNI